MTHYTVLVVGNNVEEQLDPFWELDLPENELKDDPRSEFSSKVKPEAFEQGARRIVEEYCPDDERYTVLLAEGYFKEILINFNRYSEHEGALGYWKNPRAKWDWYSVGGRWTGLLKLKEGCEGEVGNPGLMTDPSEEGYCDSALKKDIDWDDMNDFETYAVLKDGVWYERGQMGWWGIQLTTDFTPGEWTQKFKELLDSVPDDMLLTIVDCHI